MEWLEIVPQDAHDFLTKAQIVLGGSIVGIASCMGMVAGLMRTLGLREEGKKRYKDAIAGMGMVLTAPAIMLLVASILKAFFPAHVAVIQIGSTLKVLV